MRRSPSEAGGAARVTSAVITAAFTTTTSIGLRYAVAWPSAWVPPLPEPPQERIITVSRSVGISLIRRAIEARYR
jgi:hypothetical protein